MKILVIGGYGNFGRRLVRSLVQHHRHEVLVAGRSAQKCIAFKLETFKNYGKDISYAVVDLLKADLVGLLQSVGPDVVVNAAGPYQLQVGNEDSYRLARACIRTSCHYIDLADDRHFVSRFSEQLNGEAKQSGVMLVSGASSVPGLTAAVIDGFSGEFSILDSIDYGISPGNKTERGEATVASILSYTGKAFTSLRSAHREFIYGWQDLCRYDFGAPLGKRWMSNCDIPDLDILAKRYPSLKDIRFQAGLELSVLHIGLWGLSWVSRIGWVKNWARYSKIMTRMSEWFMRWGSDAGGMFVELQGKNLTGGFHHIVWQLVAENGVGINVPTISAELVIDRISKGEVITGAMPCVGLFNLRDFFTVAGRWGIYQRRMDE